MDAIQALRGFRQTRQFQERAVPEELLGRLLEVARWSGSSRNSQPWSFLVVTDRGKLRRLAEIIPFGKFVADAPLAFVPVMDGSGSGQTLDAGRVSERVMVGAHALGLGAGVATINQSQTDLVKQALDLFGVPGDRSIGVAIAIGYPAPPDPNAPPRPNAGRRPLSDLVHRDSW